MQELQHFEIITFDKHVTGFIPANAFYWAWQQSSSGRCEGYLACFLFSVPVQAVLLFTFINHFNITKQLPQCFEIHSTFTKSFGEYYF
ncbi:hypothetical protein RN20_12270 [Xanthomonas phaseoli pv. phaseoli]|uniref:Uncharacterized protein n=1 Tax=Xanthomonas campestris pv. phaseoli TaxID=317013 RepID=A0AB34QL39_XANCH|nr:hypothetical protein RN20_12270 [Xanthomonas phaseoli pv. phaseoli]